MPRRPQVFASLALLTLALTACESRNPPIPEQWVIGAIPPYQKAKTLPPATHEGTGPDGSLLAAYAERTPRAEQELGTWMLPFQAKTMVVELLIAAAKDDPERMKLLLTDNARWGAPDRRELRARPIVSEDDPHGAEFLAAFRRASSRFGKKASFTCTPLQPGWQNFAASGAEPVWCSYTSNDNLDIIGFRLIMEDGRLKTDYVGFFPERQSLAIRVPNAGDPPPLTPYSKRPVDLTLPDLMPDGSNPVVEKKKPARRAPEPEPEPEAETNEPDTTAPAPEPADKPEPANKPEQADDADEPIPVPAKDEPNEPDDGE